MPIILTSLLQLLFNAADLVVVGWFSGSNSVAAVGSTGSLTGLIVNLFIGLSVGASVAVAHGIGSGNYYDTHEAVHTAMPIAVIGGIILSIVGILFSKTFLSLMGTPDELLPLQRFICRFILREWFSVCFITSVRQYSVPHSQKSASENT